jgi:hypothetical protein
MPTTRMSYMGRNRRGRYPENLPEMDTEGLTLDVPPPDRGAVYSTTGQTPRTTTPGTSEPPPIAQPPETANAGQTKSGGLLNQAKPSQDYLDSMDAKNAPPARANPETPPPPAPATTPPPAPPPISRLNTAATTAPAVTVEDVNALYNALLGRDGESEYLESWANSGMSLPDLYDAIAGSPEGQTYAAAQAGSGGDGTTSGGTTDDGTTGDGTTGDGTTGDGTTDDGTTGDGTTGDGTTGDGTTPPAWPMNLEQTQQYVASLYQEILGRAPLQEGLDYWVNSLMSGGGSAEDVIYNIFQSPEFGGRANSEVSNYFTTFTGQAGDSAEIAAYVQEARSQGKTLDQIREEIYNSDAARAYRASQNNNGNDGSGNVGTGSQGSVVDAVNDTQTYDATTAEASTDATAQDAQVTTRTVSPEELVENRINNLLDSNNPYIQRARTSGLQFANQRGLLNSSIAAQASEEAAIARAGEIAAQDAATYANAALANQQAQNTAGLQDAQLGTNVSMFNVGEENTINRFNAQSVNEAGQFNAAAANQAIQNFLQREQVRLLQDDQQAFTAEQNEADRVLRQLLQEQQFDFTSSENSLDRSLQSALQQNQFAFQGGENALDRQFQSGESALDRALQELLADKQLAFNQWSQTNQQDWQATQNALQMEFQYYNSNAQVSQSIMYSTMEGIASIYADPNLNLTQKQAAIQNLLNSALSMPGLLDTIQANTAASQQTFIASNYDDDGVWIGDGYPTWVSPPSDGEEYAAVVTPIVNPNTGQTFNAPNAGWTYVGQTSEEQGSGAGSDGIPSGYTQMINPTTNQPILNYYTGPNGRLYVWNPETKQMTLINTDYRGGG